MRVQSADADDATVGRAQAFQDFDGAGLSGAVRPEQAEYFAFLDLEADAAQGLHVAIALGQVVTAMIGALTCQTFIYSTF